MRLLSQATLFLLTATAASAAHADPPLDVIRLPGSKLCAPNQTAVGIRCPEGVLTRCESGPPRTYTCEGGTPAIAGEAPPAQQTRVVEKVVKVARPVAVVKTTPRRPHYVHRYHHQRSLFDFLFHHGR